VTRRRRIAFALTALCTAAASSLAILELFARLVDLRGISYYPETAAYLDTLIVDEPLGYRNRPGHAGRHYGATVQINSLGLRGPEIDGTRAPGERRILVLGDSLPFGIGVEYSDSIPALLEQLLNAKAPPGATFRTVNMGVPSYNTEQQLVQLETVGLPLAPDAVTLIFMYNDIYPRMWVFDKRRALSARIAQRSYALSLSTVLLRDALAAFRSSAPGPPADGYRPDHPRWLAIDHGLSEMNRLCEAAGIPFVVFSVANGHALELVEQVGRREGFPVEILSPFDDPRLQPLHDRDCVNSPSDSHPNPRGARLHAEVLYDGLVRLGIVERVLARSR
jgi:hypothetical protein